jgi:DNA-binding NtrC family response regulator
MLPRVLVVDPDLRVATTVQQAFGGLASVEGCADFFGARRVLLSSSINLLVTNLRLEAYNGLHLVYLSSHANGHVVAVVYTERRELEFAREVQKANAFYEIRDRLPFVVTGYISPKLPSSDRRDPAVVDRRRVFRGGRRGSDLPALVLS